MDLQCQTIIDVADSLESQDGEYDGTGVYCGECIAETHDDDVSHAVIVWSIVATESYERAKSQTKTVENLSGCIQPHRWLQ